MTCDQCDMAETGREPDCEMCGGEGPQTLEDAVRGLQGARRMLAEQGAPVTITEELTATISTDLDKALAGR